MLQLARPWSLSPETASSLATHGGMLARALLEIASELAAVWMIE